MKKQVVMLISVLLLATLACSLQRFQVETGEPQIVFVNEPITDKNLESQLVFKMGGGNFIITPGADGLVTGSIKYNVAAWAPEFIRRDQYFEIRQENPFRINTIPIGNVENTWELGLNSALPINLTIEGGASENNFDFSGVTLTNLKITQGASDTTIQFNHPNPVVMQDFTFTTGASSARLLGLANANFKRMTMSGGAGNYTLDFSGNLSQDAVVDVKAGVSNFTIIIPAGIKAIIVNNGAVINVNTQGTWLLTDQTYTTLNEGFTLRINLDLSVGNVTLIHKE